MYVNVGLPRSVFVSRILTSVGVGVCGCVKGASTLFPLPPGTTASGLIYVRTLGGLRAIVTFVIFLINFWEFFFGFVIMFFWYT